MFKFNKKVGLIALLLFLTTGCNIATTSSSIASQTSSVNSSLTTSSNVDITALSISTDSPTTQFIGLTSRVIVRARVNDSTNFLQPIKWFVDDELSATQNGMVFEFFPNAVKSYNIKAQVGSLTSNVIQINVDQPSFTLSQVTALNANTIEIKGDAGLSFSLNGLTIASSSNYNFVRGVYTLNLLNTMIQGNSYNITVSKPGFKNLVFPFVYENRKLEIGYVLYRQQRVALNTDGSYVLTKPFSAGSTANYTISLKHTNLEATNVPVSIITNVPQGADAVAPIQTTTTLVRNINYNREFTLTSTTAPGLYTHNVQIGGLSLVVRIVVANPEPTLDIGTAFIYDDPVFSNNAYSPMTSPFAQDSDGKFINDEIKPDANGNYVVFRPYNGLAKEMTFRIKAENFATPLGFPAAPATPYNLITALSGPSGGVMYYANTVNTLTTSYPFRESVGDSVRITQYIDNKTALGTYNYTFTVTGTGVNRTKTISVIVREFAPTIEPIVVYNNQTIKANADGSFTVYKPLGSNTLTGTISAKLSNFESPLITAVNSADGLDTYYNDGTSLRYFLNYKVSYTGPLVSVPNQNTKVAIELGVAQNAIDTTTVASQQATPVTYPRYLRAGSSMELELTALRDSTNYVSSSIFSSIANLNANSFPGTHIFNVQIGTFTRQIVIRVQEPQALLFTNDDIVQFGTTAQNATKNNVTYVASEDKYYVNGTSGVVKVNVFAFGMPTGSYPYTYTFRTPSGLFQSNTNVVALTLDSNPYTGLLSYPNSGPGSEMKVSQALTEEGEYQFSFNINGLTKEVRVVVLPSPQLKLVTARINLEELPTFNNVFYLTHSTSSRFVELELKGVNLESDYTYVVNSTGEFPTGEALINARNPLILLEDSTTSIGITVPARDNANASNPEQHTFLIALYDGNVRVGLITKVIIVSEPVKTTIFFNTNGGNIKAPITGFVGGSTSALFPANPTKSGSTFDGWFTNPELTVAYTGTTYPTADLILYAKWTTP